jgi:hypothetical protein
MTKAHQKGDWPAAVAPSFWTPRIARLRSPAGAARLVLPLGDERDVLDLRLPERVHDVHDRRVLRVLVTLEIDDFFLLLLEDALALRDQIAGRNRQRVDVEPAARVNRSCLVPTISTPATMSCPSTGMP